MISAPTWPMPANNTPFQGHALHDVCSSASALKTAETPKPAMGTEHICRTVIFATQTAASDLPVPADFPASLLPLGSENFIERVLEELSDLGLREVDLVVSDQPEALRLLLGEGERWGITLRWHLVKASNTPYAMLRHLACGTQRVLIGHADHWVSSGLLQQMQTKNAIALDGATTHWCGWASLTGEALLAVNTDTDMARLFDLLKAVEDLQTLKAEPQDHAFGGDALQLLAAQQQALSLNASSIPASWVITPWGAMSPDARVSAHAVMLGPVLAGPGCFVHADAQVGPNVVLAGDVIVTSEARISNSVVMTGTFVGHKVELHGAIARGNLIQQVGSGKRINVATSDAAMLLHTEMQFAGVAVTSRVAAALGLTVLLPWFLLDLAFRRLTGAPKRWRPLPAVVAATSSAGELQTLQLRSPPEICTSYGRIFGYFGGMLDVLQGRRCWFGIRPRNAAQWHALSADWQRIFAQASIGLFHAPAWTDVEPAAQLESFAVADAYISVKRSTWQRCALCCAIVLGAVGPKPPAPAQLSRPRLPRVQPNPGTPS